MVQMQSDQSGIGNEKELVKLAAQVTCTKIYIPNYYQFQIYLSEVFAFKVIGLGPIFTLILTLENMNNDKPLYGLSVAFHTKPTIYQLSEYLIQVNAYSHT